MPASTYLRSLPFTGLLRLATASLALSAQPPAPATQRYDLVLVGGRVMDPESGLDGVRSIGIRAGRISTISTKTLEGLDRIDVRGLVVAPGFIDLHVHAQDPDSYRLLARDGVTTAGEFERGTFEVGRWYAEREGRALINYSAAAGHQGARIALLHGNNALADPSVLQSDTAAWVRRTLSGDDLDSLVSLVERGLREGAPGVGLIIQQTPAASRDEILRMFGLAAHYDVPCFVHVRSQGRVEPGSSVEAAQEVIADAAVTGASVHVMHLPAMGLDQTPLILTMFDQARRHGVDITAEAYPYTAAYQRLSSAMFDPGWQERLGITYQDILWPLTGERLTAETFARYRRIGGGPAILFTMPESLVAGAMADTNIMIGSDGVALVAGRGHPRLAGTHARVLGRYVRELKVLTLMDAIRKMTLLPARRLERAVPGMRAKGRIQVGADADVTIFDPDRVTDRATYEHPAEASEGIVHVFVRGIAVVRDGRVLEGIAPGRPIRRILRAPN